MKLRPISTLLLLLSATFTAMISSAEDISADTHIVTQASTQRLGNSEALTVDLGTKMAVVFYYTDKNGDRLLVTTIGPKDPDSKEVATQQIVKMKSEGEVVINFDNYQRSSEPMQLSARFEGNALIVALNKKV